MEKQTVIKKPEIEIFLRKWIEEFQASQPYFRLVCYLISWYGLWVLVGSWHVPSIPFSFNFSPLAEMEAVQLFICQQTVWTIQDNSQWDGAYLFWLRAGQAVCCNNRVLPLVCPPALCYRSSAACYLVLLSVTESSYIYICYMQFDPRIM